VESAKGFNDPGGYFRQLGLGKGQKQIIYRPKKKKEEDPPPSGPKKRKTSPVVTEDLEPQRETEGKKSLRQE